MKRNHKWLRCATACLLVFMLMNCSVSSAGLAASDESPGTTHSVGTQAEDNSVPADNSAGKPFSQFNKRSRPKLSKRCSRKPYLNTDFLVGFIKCRRLFLKAL